VSTASGPEADLDAELARLSDLFVERLRRGEVPSVEVEASAHPLLAERIRRVFPVLAAMESLQPPSSREVPLPARVGPYRVLRLLGEGGMGRVFEARAEEGAAVPEGTRVALKVVHPHLAADGAALARFLREAQLGRRVVHENVVRTLDSGVTEGPAGDAPYLVLEFVEGQTLRALLDEVGPVSERLARLVALEAARGLAALHAAGVVHRDVKPENLIITPGERVRLMDLGVASLVDGALRVSRTGEFVGTLLYAAPEQIAGAPPEARGDLYALGLVLFELLAGHHPLRAPGGARATVEPSLVALPGGTTPFTAALVRALLARDPVRRLPSAAALAEVLERGEASTWWQSHAAPSAGRPWAVERPGEVALFGRENELTALDSAWNTARDGGGGLLLLEGEPGVGKSRLAREWVRRRHAAEPALAVLAVDYSPRADPTPPVGAALREHLGVQGLEQRLAGHLGTSAALAPALAAALTGRDPSALPLDAYAGALARVLTSLAASGGLVLLVEDVHEAGAAELAVLQRLVRSLRGAPALVLATLRSLPEGHPALALATLDGAATLRIEGLPPEAATALARAALGTGGASIAPSRLATASGGNPLLLLELVREARLPDRRSDAPTPAGTLDGLLRARLARLDADARTLLEAAACAGRRFDPLLVAEAAGLPRIAALKRFVNLEREHGLLRAEGAEVVFRHPLVREALLAALPPALKQAYALALAEALEARDLAAVGGNRAAVPDPCAQTLVHLFLQGGRPARAGPYVLRALTAYARAGRQDARDALVTQVGGREGLRRILSGASLARALLLASRSAWDDSARATAELEEAHALATAAGDPELMLEVRLAMADRWYDQGEFAKARWLLQQAVPSAETLGKRDLEGEARASLCDTLRALGLLEEALTEGRKALALTLSEPPSQVELEVRTGLAMAAHSTGRRDEAREVTESGLLRARSVGDRHAEMTFLILGSILDADGARFLAAVEKSDRAADLAFELGQRGKQASSNLSSARVLLMMGRLEEARARLDTSRALNAKTSDAIGLVLVESLDALIDLDLGATAAAAEHVALGVAHAQAIRYDGGLVTSRLVQVRVLCALGDVEGARQAFEQVVASCHAAGMQGREARLKHARALLADAAGDVPTRVRAWDDAVAAAGEELTARGWALLGRGRARAEAGRIEEARADHEQALAWSRAAEVPAVGARARAPRGARGGPERPAARAAREAAQDRSPLLARLEARLLLGRALEDPALLAAARSDLTTWLSGSPPAARTHILERVPLARAAGAHARG
jgi:tetratricopeptide (TPR) repeat protein